MSDDVMQMTLENTQKATPIQHPCFSKDHLTKKIKSICMDFEGTSSVLRCFLQKEAIILRARWYHWQISDQRNLVFFFDLLDFV